MKRRIYALKEAEKIVPLLRSIGKEIHVRRRATEELQKRLDLVRGVARAENSVLRGLEAQIATHLREIRSSERELDHLGCRLDERHPLRILIPSSDGAWAFDGSLDDTRFYAAPAGGVS
jgi:hypothetical protein